MNPDKYLYDIVEDYIQSGTEEERQDIFRHFCSLLWADENKRRTYTKTIRFSVRPDLLDTDMGQLFHAWSRVSYKSYKSLSQKTGWCSLLRQKINNLYSRYFDKEIILDKAYMELLKAPKQLYLKWESGELITMADAASLLCSSANEASRLRLFCQKQKMDLSWTDYKALTETFLAKILDNCKTIDAYEAQGGYASLYDFINEDNFYIHYFCKCLTGELLKWQKQYYHVRDHKQYKRCALCGALIEKTGNRRMYCPPCARQKAAADALLRKRRQRQRDTTKQEALLSASPQNAVSRNRNSGFPQI